MIVRRYGAHPLHLVGHLALFALTAYALLQIFDELDKATTVVVWLIGAVVLHDAVLWPLYSGASTAGARVLGRWTNYVRVPLGLSLVLLLAFFGTVSNRGEAAYRNASDASWSGYVGRWLLVTAVLFALSAVVAVVRHRRSP